MRAFNITFKDRKISKIHTNKELQFINKLTQHFFQELGILWFATKNETKAQVVERFNKTLK